MSNGSEFDPKVVAGTIENAAAHALQESPTDSTEERVLAREIDKLNRNPAQRDELIGQINNDNNHVSLSNLGLPEISFTTSPTNSPTNPGHILTMTITPSLITPKNYSREDISFDTGTATKIPIESPNEPTATSTNRVDPVVLDLKRDEPSAKP